MRMFCSSNILCQENFSFELSFVQHGKQLLSELIRLEGFITLTNFQFMFLSIDIIHLTRISPSRKNEAKRKNITFSFNFTFIVEQTLLKTCPGTHYYGAKFPQNPLFILYDLFHLTFHLLHSSSQTANHNGYYFNSIFWSFLLLLLLLLIIIIIIIISMFVVKQLLFFISKQ